MEHHSEEEKDYNFRNYNFPDSEDELPREIENYNTIIYPMEIKLNSQYIWEIETHCRKIGQIRREDKLYVDNDGNIRITRKWAKEMKNLVRERDIIVRVLFGVFSSFFLLKIREALSYTRS